MALLAATVLVVPLSSSAQAAPDMASSGAPIACTQEGNPGFGATFWNPYAITASTTDAQVNALIAAKQSVNINEAIVVWSAFRGKDDVIRAAYPSDPKLGYTPFNMAIPRMVQAAQASGTKLWMGLTVAPEIFERSDNITNQAFLDDFARQMQELSDDLYAKYGSAIAGWYIPTEPDEHTVATPEIARQHGKWLGQISKYLHEHNGNLPVMVSPSMPRAIKVSMSATTFVEKLEPMMAEAGVDVWNIQDGYRMTAWSPAEEVAAFKLAVPQAAKYGAEVWAAVYTPSDLAPEWNSDGEPLGRLPEYLRALGTTGIKLSQWIFDQYMNPDPNHEDAVTNVPYFNAYKDYCMAVPQPVTALTGVAQSASTVLLRWTQAAEKANAPIITYKLTRSSGGARTEVASLGRTGVFVDTTVIPGTDYQYRVVAVDQWGMESPAALATATVPSAEPGLEAGRPYTMTSTGANNDTISYPDRAQLTDGLIGKGGPLNSAWRGVRVTDGGTVTWTIDLGAARTVSEINSRWLYQPGMGVFLPSNVSYSLSTDNVTFAPAGMAGPPSAGTAANVGGQILDYRKNIAPTTARYVRVSAKQLVNGWIFTDELSIK